MATDVKQPFQLKTIMLRVGDVSALDRCRDWYLRLGLQLSLQTPGESYWFDTGSGTLLGIHTGHRPADLTLYLGVPDVDELHRRLAGEGLEFETSPQDQPWGGRVALLRDPVGHQIGLVTYKTAGG